MDGGQQDGPWMHRVIRVGGSVGGWCAAAALAALASQGGDEHRVSDAGAPGDSLYGTRRHAVLAALAAVVGVATCLREVRLVAGGEALPGEGAWQLGARPWVTAAVLVYAGMFYAGAVARCAEGRDLQGRVAGELLRQYECGQEGEGLTRAGWGLGLGAAFVLIEGVLHAERHWIDARPKAAEEGVDGGGEEARGGQLGREGRGLWHDSRNLAAFLLGTVLGAGCLVWVLHRALWAPSYIPDAPSVCPATGENTDLFFQGAGGARENDLDCCPWQSHATCCRRSACAAKVDAPTVQGKPGESHVDGDGQYVDICNDLLGLLNCAPCRRDSGLFSRSTLSSSSTPWRHAALDVCEGFCDELLAACGRRARGEWEAFGPCAFGPDKGCPFVDQGTAFAASVNGSADSAAPARFSLGAAQFCEGLGLAVAPAPNCFSPAAARHIAARTALLVILPSIL